MDSFLFPPACGIPLFQWNGFIPILGVCIADIRKILDIRAEIRIEDQREDVDQRHVSVQCGRVISWQVEREKVGGHGFLTESVVAFDDDDGGLFRFGNDPGDIFQYPRFQIG